MYTFRTVFMCVWYPLPRVLNHSSTSASRRSVIRDLRDTGFNPLRTQEHKCEALRNFSPYPNKSSESLREHERLLEVPKFGRIESPRLRLRHFIDADLPEKESEHV